MPCQGPYVDKNEIKKAQKEIKDLLINKYKIIEVGGPFFGEDIKKAWKKLDKIIEELITLEAFDAF